LQHAGLNEPFFLRESDQATLFLLFPDFVLSFFDFGTVPDGFSFGEFGGLFSNDPVLGPLRGGDRRMAGQFLSP